MLPSWNRQQTFLRLGFRIAAVGLKVSVFCWARDNQSIKAYKLGVDVRLGCKAETRCF